MELACDLEVDVNGEGTFFLDKKILSSFSGRLTKLLSKNKVMSPTKTLKVVLHGLPGGPESFELITKFCYDNGKIQLTPANTCLLHCAAHFMEMAGSSSSSPSPSLIEETEKSLEGVPYWMWSEIVCALKQCQDLFPLASSAGVLDRLLDSLVARIMTPADTSPSGSSPDSPGFRFSFDTRSTTSAKNGHHRTWWFEDLVCFGPQVIEKGARTMMLRKLDHVSISRFLFYYLKARLANASPEEKRKATETVVDLLSSLDRSSVSCRSLFWILRVSSSQNLSKCCRSRLESMIGVQIDQVTLDNLLVPAQPGMGSLYDVDLIMRFLKYFLCGGGREVIPRLRKVGSLMDLYLPEVAPDSGLKPAKFAALVTALPDVARDSHDEMYRAIDMYLEVHARLSEEEKMKICCAINYEKLSMGSCKHLAQNAKFPSRTAIQALVSQQSKLRSLLKDGNSLRSFGCGEEHADEGEQIVLYAKKVDLSVENEKLRANLQGMQWRVMELEKVCRSMRSQMARMTKTKVASHGGGSRSLPKLCS